MKTEIERKFLVIGQAWRAVVGEGQRYEQGYVSSGNNSVTVRVRKAGARGFLTLKGPTRGISRAEVEYEIPAEEAEYMLAEFCDDRVVSKTRYLLPLDGVVWEIDEFDGENSGLIVAEVELESVGQRFEKPEWIGEEVSFDSRYFNVALAHNPFASWEHL